uniref:Uncharacterized protein n=1 Tax=Arundo donax TaxID=35708 RepID=A0A0A9DPJ0_ARUDO
MQGSVMEEQVGSFTYMLQLPHLQNNLYMTTRRLTEIEGSSIERAMYGSTIWSVRTVNSNHEP